MPKVHWLDVPQTSSYRLVVGAIPLTEPDSHALYSPLLRATMNLASRACAKLRLKGRYALQGARSPQFAVHVAFEKSEDAETFGSLVGLTPPLTALSRFTFGDQISAELKRLGGPANHKNNGRRARQSAERQTESLEWASRPFQRSQSPMLAKFRN